MRPFSSAVIAFISSKEGMNLFQSEQSKKCLLVRCIAFQNSEYFKLMLEVNNLSKIIVSCKQTESLQPTNLVFIIVCLFSSPFLSGIYTNEILETQMTMHMIKDLPERNALLALGCNNNQFTGNSTSAKRFTEENVWHEYRGQIFHRSFHKQRKQTISK